MNFFRLLNKDSLTLLISIIISLVLFFNSNSQKVTAIQSDLSAMIKVIAYPQKWYLDILSVKESNQYLKQLLVRRNIEISNLNSYKAENIMLREMLGFKESKFWNLEPANVTNRNSSSVRTIMIDIGVNDSIYKDSPVLDIYGLIGKVRAVGDNTSQVQLINDKNFSVSVRIGSDRSLANFIPTVDRYGILQGVRKSMDLSVGEIAYTSGISDIYPANIPVAKVISFNKDNNSPFQDVIVEIISDLNNLNYIFVIQ